MGRKTIIWPYSEKWTFQKWQLNHKKALEKRAYLQQKDLPGSLTWKFIYKSLDKITNSTEWGYKLAKNRLEPVMTEQVSLVFGKLFRSILKIFYSKNKSSGFKYL